MKNRAERLNFFLVVWLTMFSFLTGWGQNAVSEAPGAPVLGLSTGIPGLTSFYTAPGFPGKKKHQEGYYPAYSALYNRDTAKFRNRDMLYVIPSDLYYQQSGYFCKREWQMEKATHIPIRIRLGSLADCNALEGKH